MLSRYEQCPEGICPSPSHAGFALRSLLCLHSMCSTCDLMCFVTLAPGIPRNPQIPIPNCTLLQNSVSHCPLSFSTPMFRRHLKGNPLEAKLITLLIPLHPKPDIAFIVSFMVNDIAIFSFSEARNFSSIFLQ